VQVQVPPYPPNVQAVLWKEQEPEPPAVLHTHETDRLSPLQPFLPGAFATQLPEPPPVGQLIEAVLVLPL
jgi:hypothetical protein